MPSTKRKALSSSETHRSKAFFTECFRKATPLPDRSEKIPTMGQGMLVKKPVGRAGGALKYDLLTILSVHALAQGKTLQRQTLRLICLITARYNWQNDHLSVGQAEIARLWSVDPRTVKREMAAFRARGWLVEKRAAARGRVTVYGLGIERILQDTQPSWDCIGPDLMHRLLPETQDAEKRTIIPFPQATPTELPEGQGAWPRIARRLQMQDGGTYRAWFATLSVQEQGDEIWLKAPSSFHASYLRTHHHAVLDAAAALEAPGMRLYIQ